MPDAVRAVADRAHTAALLLAAALGDPDPAAVTSAAWQAVRADPELTVETIPAALLAQVLSSAATTGDPATPPTPLGTFAPGGDRWAGWWETEPPAWPDGFEPGTAQVVAALRQLPVAARSALVLRHSAGLAAAKVGRLLGHRGDVGLLVERARQQYLVAIDRTVTEETVDERG